MYNFGTGMLTLTPSGSNPTPAAFGVLQEVDLGIEFVEKALRGEMQFPVTVARGAASMAGSAKWGRINAQLNSSLLTGSTIATGETRGAANEAGTIPGTPYAVTVTNSATFVADLGVWDVTAGIPMVRVASSPATGQYSVSAGVYTFAAADTTHSVFISYSYTGAGGKTVTYNNQLMGAGTTYGLTVFNQYGGTYHGLKIFAVTLSKLAFPFRSEDFTIQDTTITAYADSSGRVLEEYVSG